MRMPSLKFPGDARSAERPQASPAAGAGSVTGGSARNTRAGLVPDSIDVHSTNSNQRPKVIPHSRINSLTFPREALATRAARAES